MSSRRLRDPALWIAAFVVLLCGGLATPAVAQTIEGTLMEVGSDRPISLGLVILMTQDGDSITSAVTNSQGRFSLTAPEPGVFSLIASAFGFKETSAHGFDLGPDGSMDIEFRVGAEAMPIDGLLVELQRPALQHNLVTSGFVRRLQRGTGIFITPFDIERSAAISTPDLFRGIPGVAVTNPAGGLFAFAGQQIQFVSAAGYCTPTVYMDGVRLSPNLVQGQPIQSLVPIDAIDAVEIYRRPGEVPTEYAGTGNNQLGEFGVCGVLVLWTKRR